MYTHGGAEGSEAAEYAARLVAALGEPSDSWILDQAGNPHVSPRTLYGLVHQYITKGTESNHPPADFWESFISEFRESASGRFLNLSDVGLADLHYLGAMWLLVDAHKEAERTAIAIIDIRKPEHLKRTYDTRALKLLAFAASKRRLDPSVQDQIASLYNQLRSAYTPEEEKEDWNAIERFLKK